MPEYKVSFKARLRGLFGQTYESMWVYEANTAREATEMCIKDFNRSMADEGVDEEDVILSITNVEKV